MPYRGEIYDVDVEELDARSDASNDPLRFIGVRLMAHQRRAVHRCREMESLDATMRSISDGTAVFMKTSIGVYADPVGSGKSHVILALISGDQGLARGLSESATKLQTYADGRIQITEMEYIRPLKTTVIVVPHNLTTQWESYMQPLTQGGMKCMVVSRMKAVDRLSACDIGEFDIILVTNTFYESVAHLFTYRGVKPRRVVVDEADSIAISSAASIKASFTWFITSSYGNLIFPIGNMRYDVSLRQNVTTAKGIIHQGFIRTLFVNLHNTLSRSNFKRLVVKNSASSVQESMNMRSITHTIVTSLTPHSIRVLTGVVDRQVMACLNSGDIWSAVEQVAEENRHSKVESVVGCMSKTYTQKIVEAERQMDRARRDRSTGYEDDMIRLNVTVADLRNKIACMRTRLTDSNMCCICLEETQVNAVVPCCATKMCLECVARWVLMKSTCVLCRRPLAFSDLHVIEVEGMGKSHLDPMDADRLGVHQTKMENMELILRNHLTETSKVLIYCNEDNGFADICVCLSRQGKTYEYIRGGHKQVSNTVEAYKDERIDVLLINTTHYGSGLNLENTTDIIMFNSMSTEVEKQVIGRAQRMGRVSDLRVWHLLHEHEVHPSS